MTKHRNNKSTKHILMISENFERVSLFEKQLIYDVLFFYEYGASSKNPSNILLAIFNIRIILIIPLLIRIIL